MNVHLIIRAADPNVSVSSLLNAIAADSSVGLGLTRMTQAKPITKVTILVRDGVIRVEGGKTFSCDSEGNCK
jgi:hypothetical protein